MAKTNDNDVFVVTPNYIQKVVSGIKNGNRPRVWYLNMFTRPELERLTEIGESLTRTTKTTQRTVSVVAVASVEPGSKHRVKVNGKNRVLTVPVPSE